MNHWPDFALGTFFGAALVMAFVRRPKWERKVGGKQYCFYVGILWFLLALMASVRFFLGGGEFSLVMGCLYLAGSVRWAYLYRQAPELQFTTLGIDRDQDEQVK